MKKIVRLPAIILYLIATLCFALYLFVELNQQMLMSPIARLILLGAICVFTYFGSLLFSKTTTNETAYKIMKTTFSVFFALYVFLLITLILFDKYFGRVGFSLVNLWKTDTITYYIQNSLNLIPLKTIFEYFYGAFISSSIAVKTAITNIFGNIVAFVPFAFFLPLLFNKYKSFKKFIITMLIIVILVEILQFVLLTGSCDIDDVILNVAGACIAYKILNVKIIKNLISKITTL